MSVEATAAIMRSYLDALLARGESPTTSPTT
jgi:hypothetical protein